ncbi:MAG: stalk domain-containing protein [Bacillota bacterium]
MRPGGLAILLALVLFLVSASYAEARQAVFAIGSTSYAVDGETRTMDVAPYLKNGRAYLPVRFASQALGVAQEHIGWDNAAGTVTLVKGDRVAAFTVGQTTMLSGGTFVAIDAAPEIVNGRVMLPFRWVAFALGAQVEWNGAARTITMTAASIALDVAPNVTPDAPDPIKKKYSWNYGGKPWTWDLQVPREAYAYYTGLERPPTDDYSVYVTDPADDRFIAALAGRFLEAARREAYSPKQTAEFVTAFVQSVKYVDDNVSKGVGEYPRYPLETLVEWEGDCEDTSILLASLLQGMSIGAVLIHLSGDPAGHMAVGVKGENLPGVYYEYGGARYYYVETTNPRWSIGEIPDEYRNREARILSLTPRAVIAHEWAFRGVPGGQLELKVTVRNHGTAAARETKVYAAWDAGGGMVYDPQWSDPLDLEPRAQGVYTLRLRPPANVNTRLIVKIVSNGLLMDESTSNWLRT